MDNYDDYNMNMQYDFMSTIASHVLEYLQQECLGTITVDYTDMMLLINIDNNGYTFYHEIDLSTGLYAKNDLSYGIARWIIKVYKEKVLKLFFKQLRY